MFDIVDDIERRVKEIQKKYDKLSAEFKAISDKHQQLNIEHQALKTKTESAYQRLTQLLTQLPEQLPEISLNDDIPSPRTNIDPPTDTNDSSNLSHNTHDDDNT